MSHAVLLLRKVRGRNRERDRDRDQNRERDRDRHRDRDQTWERDRDQDQHRDRDQTWERDRDQHRDQDWHQDQNRERDQGRNRNRDLNWHQDQHQDWHQDHDQVQPRLQHQDWDQNQPQGQDQYRDSAQDRDCHRHQALGQDQHPNSAQDRDCHRNQALGWDSAQYRDCHRHQALGWDQHQDSAQYHDHHQPQPQGQDQNPDPTPSPLSEVSPIHPPRHRRGRHRRPYPAQRVYRARCSFLELSEEQALRRCRLDRAAIAALCGELCADLQSLTGRSHALPVAVKVTSALAFLASGSLQAASRLSAGISQSAMSNCLAQFLAALQRRAPRFIAFPAPPSAAPAGSPGLPGVLGLVGSAHVALRAPAEREPLFRNAARAHSVNAQVVVDPAGHITNVVAKFPGSCPNHAVLENSALARLMDRARPEGVWLLGDQSYPLKPWLLTPIRGARGAAELRYNALHRRSLRPLRRTLALLRGRFRCLAGGGLQYSPPKVCQIFLACCVLHNIALRRRLPLEPPEGLPPPPPEPPAPPPPPPGPGDSEGRAVRARLVQRVREGMG